MKFGVIGLAIAASATATQGAELSKSEAGQILAFMGCNPSRVAAIANGVGPVGLLGGSSGGNSAVVFATCQRNGKATAEEHAFLYDVDLGWFYYEKNQERAQIRLWTKTGYKQIDAPPSKTP